MAIAKISRGVLPGLFILLLIAAGAIFSHRTKSASACRTASGGVPPPGNRLCCAFGFAYGCDPAVLTNPTAPKHNYGNQPEDQPLNSVPYAACHGSEPVGYVYTAAAGLVDVGHVRDNADMTFLPSVYNQLLKKQHSIATGGNSAGVVNIPTDSKSIDRSSRRHHVGHLLGARTDHMGQHQRRGVYRHALRYPFRRAGYGGRRLLRVFTGGPFVEHRGD